VSGEYLSDLLNMQDTEFPIHIVRKNLEAEIQDLQYINEYKPKQALFDTNVKIRDLDELKSLKQSVEDLEADPEFDKLATLAINQKAAVINKAVAYNSALVDTKKQNLNNPKIAKFKADDKNTILKADILYEDFGFYDKVNDNTGNVENTDKKFALGFLAKFEPRLFALETSLIDSSKEEIMEKRKEAFTAAETQLSTIESKLVESETLCKTEAEAAVVAKTIINYKGAINTKLANVRSKPVNEDELRIIEAKAAAKARGKARPTGE
jgi:hypothetical protein